MLHGFQFRCCSCQHLYLRNFFFGFVQLFLIRSSSAVLGACVTNYKMMMYKTQVSLYNTIQYSTVQYSTVQYSTRLELPVNSIWPNFYVIFHKRLGCLTDKQILLFSRICKTRKTTKKRVFFIVLSVLQIQGNNEYRLVNSRVNSIVLKCLETLVEREPRVYEIASQSTIDLFVWSVYYL
jgi:hypothetical protein